MFIIPTSFWTGLSFADAFKHTHDACRRPTKIITEIIAISSPGVSLRGPLDALDTPVCFEDKTYFARQEFCGMKKKGGCKKKKKQQKEMAEFYTIGRSSIWEGL